MEASGQIHAPAALHLRKFPSVPIRGEVLWAPEQVWTRWIGN